MSVILRLSRKNLSLKVSETEADGTDHDEDVEAQKGINKRLNM